MPRFGTGNSKRMFRLASSTLWLSAPFALMLPISPRSFGLTSDSGAQDYYRDNLAGGAAYNACDFSRSLTVTKPSLFIASSREGLAIAQAIEFQLQNDAEV